MSPGTTISVLLTLASVLMNRSMLGIQTRNSVSLIRLATSTSSSISERIPLMR